MSENSESLDFTGILHGPAQAEDFTPSEAENRLVADIQKRMTYSEQDKDPHAYEWEFNRAYLRGDQVHVRDLNTGAVHRLSVSRSSKYLVSQENILRTTARAHTGKRVAHMPSFGVLPATADSTEVKAAQAAEAYIDWKKGEAELDVKYLQCQRFLPWAGSYVAELMWDRAAGRTRSYCAKEDCGYTGDEELIGQPCPQCEMLYTTTADVENLKQTQAWMGEVEQSTQMGMEPPPQPQEMPAQEAPILKKAIEGDTAVEVLDVREFFPQPGVLDPKKLQWAIVRKPMPLSEVRALFPEKGIFVSEETGIVQDKAVPYLGQGGLSRVDTRYLEDHVNLFAYHEGSSENYPNGRLIYMADEKILEEIVPHPVFKTLGRLPFYMGWSEKDESYLWGWPVINDVWQIQRERNRLLSQLRSHRELTNRPWMIKPKGINMSVSEVDNVPGRIIETKGAQFGEPKWMKLPPMAEYNYAELQRMSQQVREAFNVTDQEAGAAPPSQSGRAAALGEAQSTETIRPLIMENISEWKALYRGLILIAQERYSPDRAWTIQGRDKVRTYSWSDANLEQGWDLSLMEQDSLSKNPQVRLEQALSLQSQVGYFLDEATGMLDKARFAKVAGLAEPGVEVDADAEERLYFSQVPDMFGRGEPFVPQPWDSTRIAVEELVLWLRGPGRRADPALQQQVGQVYQYYASMLQMYPSDVDNVPSGAGGGEPGQATAGQPGTPQDQTMGAGGSNGPRASQTPQPTGVLQQTAQNIQSADAQAEGAVRKVSKHE